jgi:hypothetical protein
VDEVHKDVCNIQIKIEEEVVSKHGVVEYLAPPSTRITEGNNQEQAVLSRKLTFRILRVVREGTEPNTDPDLLTDFFADTALLSEAPCWRMNSRHNSGMPWMRQA